MVTILEAIILGIVEGLTEFIPVSSTGHLILTKAALGLGDEVDNYLVTIQLGALLAVAHYYRQRVLGMFRGLFGKDAGGRKLVLNLMVAFVPAAVVGLLFHDSIERLFFNPVTVALALIVGGILMILVERVVKPDERPRVTDLDAVTWKDALAVGVAQCFSLWPGMSRSMSTIVGAQLRGFSNSLAADFSFLLALPTLGAATLYSLAKDLDMLAPENIAPVSIGLVTSFVVGWAAVAWFLKILKRVGMTPFGLYRIVLGIVTLLLVLGGGLG